MLRADGYIYGRMYPQNAHLHVWRMALMLVSSRGRCSSTFASKSEGSASQAGPGTCCFLSIFNAIGSAHARTAWCCHWAAMGTLAISVCFKGL